MLLQQLEVYCKENFPQVFAPGTHLLVAVSGGIDSVVLVDLLHQSGISFSIAHCNFGLRGEESNRDEAFVKALAEKYQKQIFVKQFDTAGYAAQYKLSIQEAARKLRYDWFGEVVGSWSLKGDDGWQMTDDSEELHLSVQREAKEKPVNRQLPSVIFIATAHHANDNIETLLINFFRGTGISGLHGILPKQKNIIRPLLFASREAIMQYAATQQLQWVEDSSNASDKYSRNFFRHHIIPAVKEIYPAAEDNLLQNIARFGEAEQLYNQAIDLHKKKLVEKKGNEWHIPVLKLQKKEPLNTIIWEIIKDFGFAAAQITEIKKLLEAESGKYVQSSTHRIIRNRAWLIIAPAQTGEARHILIEEKDKAILYEEGQLTIKKQAITGSYQPPTTNLIAAVDAKHIQYPLLLRKWKTGDYFYPLGMTKKKKLGKFFIDLKLSKTDKEKVWVLEMDKKILWVIGYRIDDRFKITPGTKQVLTIMQQ